MNIRRITTTICLFAFALMLMAQKVNVVTEKNASNREQYAAEYLQKKLTALGYDVVIILEYSCLKLGLDLSRVIRYPPIRMMSRLSATMLPASSTDAWNWQSN